MPARDHRGPQGEGPRTGRGMGVCRGAGRPRSTRQGATSQKRGVGPVGQGGGRGRGGGRYGWRRRYLFHATGLTGWQREARAAETSDTRQTDPTDAETGQAALMALQQQADRMTAELDAIREQIQGIKNHQEPTKEEAGRKPVS